MALSSRKMSSPNTFDRSQGLPPQPLRRNEDTDSCWTSIVTEEPISQSLKELVRVDLSKAWHFNRVEAFQLNRKIEWNSVDSQRVVLGDAIGGITPRLLAYLCNKPTAFYWLQSAQRVNGFGQRDLTPGIIFAAAYEEWFRCQDTEPDIEFGHFFANMVRVSESGPETVQAVIEAHHELCEQASYVMEKAKEEAEDSISNIDLNPRHYYSKPTYRAIVMLLDRLDFQDKGQRLNVSGRVSLRRLARRQTVLLARTGIEEDLTTSISFASLRSQSFPLARPDLATDSDDVIRVSLTAAVNFITKLEAKEDLSYAETKKYHHRETRLDPLPPEDFEDQKHVCSHPEAWANAVIASAENHGYDKIAETWMSVRRIKASMIGQAFCQFEHQPLPDRWRY